MRIVSPREYGCASACANASRAPLWRQWRRGAGGAVLLCALTAGGMGIADSATAQAAPPTPPKAGEASALDKKPAEGAARVAGRIEGHLRISKKIARVAQDNAEGKDKAKTDASQGAADSQNGDDSDDEDLISPDRPGIADSSYVIGPKRLQLEIGLETDFLGQGANSARLLTVPTLLRAGIDKRYEFRVETLGYSALSLRSAGAGITHAEGLSPLSFGFKRQFQTSKGPRHPSVGMIARLYAVTGGGAFHLSHATYDVRLAADWDFAPKLSLNPNAGLAVYEDGAGRLFATGLFANTLTYAPNKHLGLFIDAGLQTQDQAGGEAALIYDAGATYILGRNVQLDVSVGTGAAGRATPHPFWAAGVSVRF